MEVYMVLHIVHSFTFLPWWFLEASLDEGHNEAALQQATTILKKDKSSIEAKVWAIFISVYEHENYSTDDDVI